MLRRKYQTSLPASTNYKNFVVIFASIDVHLSILSSRRQETVSVPSVFNNKTGPLFLNSIDVKNFLALKKIAKTVT